MKKIMFLGGSKEQIPAIKYAKERGYYTILCDYLKDNPGQFYANEYHCVSIVDKKAVLEVAKQSNIDGIVAFASESATLTATYVGNKLNLPSNLYETVILLSNKNLFREFLKINNFNHPKSKSFTSIIEAKTSLSEFKFPLMVKPVDSSGSRGISRIEYVEEIDNAFKKALFESPQKMVIIEEYIEMAHECVIGGDIIVLNGKISFFGVVNGHRDIENKSYIPFGNSYPTFLEERKIKLIREEIQRVIDLLEIKMGVLNIDVMFDVNEEPYIIEINARNGGNMMSKLLKTMTGVDLAKIIVEMAINNKEFEIDYTETAMCYSTYYLHSLVKGELKSITFKDEIKGNIIDKVTYKQAGEEVDVFDGLNKIIEIIFLKFRSEEELKYKMKNMNRYIDIQIIS